jgi:hypothetical protein
MVFRSSFDGVWLDASWSEWQRQRADCIKKVRAYDVDRLACGPAQMLLKRQQQL